MPDRSPHNLVLLVADGLRHDALSCAVPKGAAARRTWLMRGEDGGSVCHTPHMDQLAERGTRYTQAVTNVPLPGGAWRTLLTGHHTGPTGSGSSPDSAQLPGLLAMAGYHVMRMDMAPQGGDATAEAGGGVTAVKDWLERQAGNATPFCLLLDLPSLRGGKARDNSQSGSATTPAPPPVPATWQDDLALRRALARRTTGRTVDDMVAMVRRYAAAVGRLDSAVGAVLDALDRTGQAEPTVVALTSSRGRLLGERRAGAADEPCLYDSVIRVPLIVRWPGLRSGLVSSALVELVDVLPTFLDAASQTPPAGLPGRSLRPLLEGRSETRARWREATFTELYGTGSVGGTLRRATGASGQWALRTQRYKLIERVQGHSALYDLLDDPYEIRNRVDDAAMIDVRDFLRGRMLRDAIARAERHVVGYE